jgi:hypothetical protein
LVRQVVTVAPLIVGLTYVVFWLSAAVAVAAGAGALVWLSAHGVPGLPAAARMAVVRNGVRLFVFFASYTLTRRLLRRSSISDRIKARASLIPESVLTAAAAAALIWLVICAAVLPRNTWWPASNLRSVVAAMPNGLRGLVTDGRVSLAEYEAQGVLRCAAGNGRGGWGSAVATAEDGGVVRLTVGSQPGSHPGPRALGVLLLSLENQLVQHADVIHVAWRSGIRFAPVASSIPLLTASPLGATSGRGRAVTVTALHLSAADIDVALKCSAAAL